MKEKKFFIDTVNYYLLKPILYIVLVILIIISCVITYKICNSVFLEEFSSYSESDYTYLNKIATSICDKETKSIITSKLPNDVRITDIILNKGDISFKCTIKKDFFYASEPTITVKVPKDFKNIKITNSTPSFKKQRLTIVVISVCFGVLPVLVPFIFIGSILYLICIASEIKKEKYYADKVENFPHKGTVKLTNINTKYKK